MVSNRGIAFRRTALLLALVAPQLGVQGAIDTIALTLVDILQGLGNGTFTSVELTQAYFDQISKYELTYNAWTFFNKDALAEAAEKDALIAAGTPCGILCGVPIAIKEAMDYTKAPSTMGWKWLSRYTGGTELFPMANAVVVQRLIDAGAVVLGKTNIPAFSADGTRADTSWAGPTYNAVNFSLVPGASSSGSACATSAGMAAWAMAEETGGSIQNPAAAHSLVGVKTTFDLIPTTGVVPLAGQTRDVVGPLAKTTMDAAIAMDAIAGSKYAPKGYAGLFGKVTLKRARLGVYGLGWRNASLSAVRAVQYKEAKKTLRKLGAILIPDPFRNTIFNQIPTLYPSNGLESIVYDFVQYLKGLGVSGLADFKAKVGVTPFEPGQPLAGNLANPIANASYLEGGVNNVNLTAFFQKRAAYRSIFDAVFKKYKLDALAFPQSLEPMPLELNSTTTISSRIVATTVSEINILGVPGVTVPSTQAPGGNPFNLIFVGPPFSEAKLLALAHDYEKNTNLRLGPNLVNFYPPLQVP